MVGVLVAVVAGFAQDITAFDNGYLSFTNGNTALYYRVEFRPNLTGPEEWDGTYEGLKNIKTNAATVTVPVGVYYRVVGSSDPLPTAPVAKTGADDLGGYTETSGEDGHAGMRRGVAWPNPRFTDNSDGTVTDNLTGLIWLKNANVPGTTRNWSTALSDVAQLNTDGTMNGNSAGDTSDGGGHQTDWRLPNVQELQSIVDYGLYNPAVPDAAGTGQWSAGDPFSNVQSAQYWSSTTRAVSTSTGWFVYLYDGTVSQASKTAAYYVWPVRGGE